ncbi:MAG: Hpt domain-containing protein, partial [Opitutales bacterium]
AEPFEAADVLNVLRGCRLLSKPAPSQEAAPVERKDETPPLMAETLDLRRLREIRRLEIDGEDVMADLLDLFRQEVPHRVKELRTAVTAGQEERTHFLAHAICGVCSNLGAKQMEVLCSHLESKVLAGDRAGAVLIIEEIEREIQGVENALEKAGDFS